MPFPESNLNDEEQTVLELRPHWWFFAPQATALVAAIVLGVLSLVFGLPNIVQLMVAVAILIAIGWFLVRYVVWNATSFVITTDRLIDRSGVFTQSGIDIPLERVNTVFFRRTFFERVIGAGDLVIESAGEQGTQLVSDIRKPTNVQNEIYRQMENNENRKFDRVGRSVAPTEASIPDQIEILAELHRQGVLTDHEFQSKKTELLGRM